MIAAFVSIKENYEIVESQRKEFVKIDIMKEQNLIQENLKKHPVLFIRFRNFSQSIKSITTALTEAFKYNSLLLDCRFFNAFEKERFSKLYRFQFPQKRHDKRVRIG